VSNEAAHSSLSEVAIRPAVASDAHELARMRYLFRAGLGSAVEAEASFVARCTEWMATRLELGDPWRCWVAQSGDRLLGHTWLQLIEKIPNPVVELEKHAYITNVFVLPEARGRGLGEQLVGTALAFCREAGVDSVVLWPTERSRSLYARFGFSVRDDIMEAVLDDGRHLSH
jgi:GNAT superfamily N-acetyltransferase